MSTTNFLNEFLLKNRSIPELSQIYHHVYFKKNDGGYFGANDSILHYFDLPDHSQLLQLKEIEVLPSIEIYNAVLNNDELVKKSECPNVFYEQGFISIKSPLYNGTNIVGLLGISLKMEQYSLGDFNSIISIINTIFQQSLSNEISEINCINKKPLSINLTPREIDCLRLYMKGYTIKNIAKYLNLSSRSIEFYMVNIKNKFGVNKRSELLPLAFEYYPNLME
ncbi:LuxR family transcriptional regulator [Legionella birminghamensis]|uniref:LuxR family transcriptional regulator n=1 Tax=Legionella birminghamensis TaxID=28083 RepID=A0A378IB71_9GAMM|nr:helix-turn-helix transcriptional regulator [Legionella birminghamensis]KTC72545.1 LuxR family transcriptional regulator [Legionella birminghamensis]STX32146.1 LuxR family transcriptional regulator [Legionella birminghamensis]